MRVLEGNRKQGIKVIENDQRAELDMGSQKLFWVITLMHGEQATCTPAHLGEPIPGRRTSKCKDLDAEVVWLGIFKEQQGD